LVSYDNNNVDRYFYQTAYFPIVNTLATSVSNYLRVWLNNTSFGCIKVKYTGSYWQINYIEVQQAYYTVFVLCR
jgi:hypothetical protein